MGPSTSLGRCGAALFAFTLSLGLASPASAQEPSKADIAKARATFREAVALAAGNNCAAALVKYKEVAQVKMSPQLAFNTAECEARLGKLVAALGNYRLAASQAADDKNAAAVLKEVPSRIEDLEGRIPKLTVTRGKGADTAAIELDGTELGASQLGSAVPVDPGTHTIVAKVGSKTYLSEKVKLDEKQTKTFDVKISVASDVVEPPAPEPKPEDKLPPPEPKSKVPGIVVTALGGALIVTGLALLGPQQSDLAKLNKDCMGGKCPPADQSVGSQGATFTTMTEILVPAGAVGVIVGAVLLVKASGPSSPDAKKGEEKKEDAEKKDAIWRSIRVMPGAPGANVGGLSFVGRF